MTIICTVVFLLDKEKQKVYMAKKTKKIGVGCYTGPGGKVEGNESLADCAVQETKEEIGVDVDRSHLSKGAVVTFHNGPDFEVIVHFYLAPVYSGQPADGAEMMAGRWFPCWRLRFFPWTIKMMAADKIFLPQILAGKKILGQVTYAEGSNQGVILRSHFDEVEVLPD